MSQLDEWAREHQFLIKAAWMSMVVPGGRWPDADDLTRELFSSHRRIDVAAVARSMPAPLGRLAEGRLILTVRGGSYYSGAKLHLRSYVDVVHLAIARYRDRFSEPVVTVSDMMDLGLSAKWGVPVIERILEGEWWALSPAGGTGLGRRYQLHSNAALALATARTLPKYLEAQAKAWWPDESMIPAQPPAWPLAPPPPPSTLATSGAVAGDAIEIGWLHPVIGEACAGLLRDGHPREAVQRGATMLQTEIRRLARSDLDGDALMNLAFGRQKPRIVVASRRTQTGQSIQRGTHLLAQGIVAAIRNPTSHGLVKLTDAEAVECLAVMSLIYRRLDEVDARRQRARARRTRQ